MDSVRRVMAEGKVCLLDVHPTVSKSAQAAVSVVVCLTCCYQQGAVRSGEPPTLKCC